jgi:hypothetical protein
MARVTGLGKAIGTILGVEAIFPPLVHDAKEPVGRSMAEEMGRERRNR